MVTYYRGYVVSKSKIAVSSVIIAASISKEKADNEIDLLGLVGSIKVACINSHESVTISGDEKDIDALAAELTPRSIFAGKLKTNGRAYRSHHMTPLG